ncbi:MAG TPA: hypothetical protein V6D22_01835 [Candidatus Obscuribacterales bacterium]
MQEEKKTNQGERAPGPYVSDEEFAERIYEEGAPLAPQFQEHHDISVTGGSLRSGNGKSDSDAAAEES